MASQRHHYIPQFLLKGFASQITKKSHFVFRFAKGSKPHEVNTINVAVARSFHDGLSADLEQRISFRESNYVTALENLRKQNADTNDIILIAECVFNLMVRTKHLRVGFTILGNELFGLFDTPEAQRVLRKRALTDFAARPEIAAVLNRYPKNRRERILLTEIIKRGIDLNAEHKRVWDNIKTHIDMAQFVKHAQLKTLEIEGIPEPRKISFLSYHWSIDHHQPPGSFVLGDVGLLARVPDVDQLTFPYGFGMPLMVCLPISSAELLVGTVQPERDELSAEEVNWASAELSRDFFVASRNTTQELRYLERLGSRAVFLPKSDVLRLFEETLKELAQGK
jgi:hypothetical protein